MSKCFKYSCENSLNTTSRDVNEARTLEAEARNLEAEARTLEAEARTLEAKAEARTLEAKAEAMQLWLRNSTNFEGD